MKKLVLATADLEEKEKIKVNQTKIINLAAVKRGLWFFFEVASVVAERAKLLQ